MSDPGGFRKPITTVEAVLIELRRALLEGDFPAGARMNVDAISKKLGTSRAPVRDALRILEGERQVVYEAHRGYVVPEMALEDVFDLYRSRELLEAEAVALTVPVLTQKTIDHLHESLQRVDQAIAKGDEVTATYANRDFHFALFDAPGHKALKNSIVAIWNSDAYRAFYFKDLDAAVATAHEHTAIVEAAAAKDAAKVIALQNEHRNGELTSLLGAIRNEFGFDIDPHLDESAWRTRLNYQAPA